MLCDAEQVLGATGGTLATIARCPDVRAPHPLVLIMEHDH